MAEITYQTHQLLTVKTRDMQSKANTRTTGKEQYYTKPGIASLCSELASEFIDKDSFVIEPAAGTGEFMKAMKKVGYKKVRGYDIEPKRSNINKRDWLTVDHIKKPFSVITNPPFGRMNSLSVDFFKKAAGLEADYIAFLIPVSWRKWSLQDRLPGNYHLVLDKDLPNDFLFYGDDVKEEGENVLKCIFQVWERREEIRPRHKDLVPNPGLLVSCKPDVADVKIVQQGWSCGKVETDFDKTKNVNGCNYYKASKDTINKLEHLHATNSYSEFMDNSAYVASISLLEINSKLIQHGDTIRS